MKLPNRELGINEKLAEFDQWLTARLERIKDSEKFTSEINSLCSCVEHLAPYLNNFSEYSICEIGNLCNAVICASNDFLKGVDFYADEAHVATFYDSFFNLLFLTTGATDNNLKNHFLIKLKEGGVEPLIPKRSGGSKNKIFKLSPVPSTIKSGVVAKLLAGCYVGSRNEYSGIVKTLPVFDLHLYLTTFLEQYASLVLEDKEEVLQFWAVCHSYMMLNKFSVNENFGRYLLNSCTIYKIRGSVSASGGHITEEILRKKLQALGLQPDYDYNTIDVTIGEQDLVENGMRRTKTRAYDFIIPYKVENWELKPKLFIQSQFYAGDSGSVSHKVVDQTRSSRQFTLGKYPTARFVEYLDGAGYYAALRGDLEHMLTFSDTASFFQVKSILLRLRRELQNISFLTPIELEHTVLTISNCTAESLRDVLMADGYPEEEICRAKNVSLDSGYLIIDGGVMRVSEDRLPIARRLLTLDIAAINAKKITEKEKDVKNILLVPGYGSEVGILESKLSKAVCQALRGIVLTPFDFTSDIEWLLEEGVMKRR